MTEVQFTGDILKAEARKAWELQQSGVLRELYFTPDTHEAVLVLECESADEARRQLAERGAGGGQTVWNAEKRTGRGQWAENIAFLHSFGGQAAGMDWKWVEDSNAARAEVSVQER